MAAKMRRSIAASAMLPTLVAGLILAILGAAPLPAAGAAAGPGTVAVRVYNCPAGMRPETMVGDVCGNPITSGYALTLTTPTGTRLTLADATTRGGIITWSGLATGAYRLAETTLPAEHDAYVVDRPPAGPRPITLTRSTPKTDIALYNFKPAPTPSATLTIHNRLCPEGYAGGAFYRDCHDTPAPAGLTFAAEGATTTTGATDAAGNVALTLAPGAYTVRGGVPGEFARLTLFCAPAAAPGTRFPFSLLGGGTRGPDDPTGVRLTLAAGDAVICDWYDTPESQRG